ncbi:MAG: hypothetical protein COB36_10250 [Alphaproteobacteria bacterium]|nr:MAG: hypothetical protein COB36_10250 [Alphaproteobacteria bacterium]
MAIEFMREGVRSLDHFVFLPNDLEAAKAQYENLGFHVRPVSHHIELGSCNCIIHFATTYIELIDLSGADALLSDPYLDRLACGEGLAHVSLTCADLKTDHKRMTEIGLATSPILSAKRHIIMPDGTENYTDSSSFYMWREDVKYMSLFLCGHNKPETIFIPEFGIHPNSAIDVIRLVYMSDNPTGDISYFTELYGKLPDNISEDKVSFIGFRGDVTDILTPFAATGKYGDNLACEMPYPLKGIGVAMHISVHSLDQARAYLLQQKIKVKDWQDGIIIPASNACGCAIIFEQVP